MNLCFGHMIGNDDIQNLWFYGRSYHHDWQYSWNFWLSKFFLRSTRLIFNGNYSLSSYQIDLCRFYAQHSSFHPLPLMMLTWNSFVEGKHHAAMLYHHGQSGLTDILSCWIVGQVVIIFHLDGEKNRQHYHPLCCLNATDHISSRLTYRKVYERITRRAASYVVIFGSDRGPIGNYLWKIISKRIYTTILK